MFDRESSVQVVVTKWDLIAGNAGNEQFVDGKLGWLNGRYASQGREYHSNTWLCPVAWLGVCTIAPASRGSTRTAASPHASSSDGCDDTTRHAARHRLDDRHAESLEERRVDDDARAAVERAAARSCGV